MGYIGMCGPKGYGFSAVFVMYVCILNWPLPIGAFQDQCKHKESIDFN